MLSPCEREPARLHPVHSSLNGRSSRVIHNEPYSEVNRSNLIMFSCFFFILSTSSHNPFSFVARGLLSFWHFLFSFLYTYSRELDSIHKLSYPNGSVAWWLQVYKVNFVTLQFALWLFARENRRIMAMAYASEWTFLSAIWCDDGEM